MHDGCYDGCAACQDRVASRLAHLLREWDAGEALPPPTPAALEKHAARFGPAGVVETATEFGLDIDVSAAIPVRRPRRRRR